MSDKKEQLITVELFDLVHTLLQEFKDSNENYTSGIEKCRITKNLALILENALKETLQYKIEFNNWNGSSLDYPILWRYDDWFNAYERNQRQKEYSEQQRITRWIHDKNIENLTRVLMKKQGLSETYAETLARKLIDKGSNMEMLQLLGLNKIVTREEEL